MTRPEQSENVSSGTGVAVADAPDPERVSPRRRFLSAVAFACGGIGFWGTNALAGSSALRRLDLGIVLTLQFASATLALTVIVLVRNVRAKPGRARPAEPMARSDRLHGGVLGLIGFCGTQTMQYTGFAAAPIVEANIIAYAWPMFAAIWLAITSPRRQTVIGVFFSFVGFLGVAMMTAGQHSGSGGGSLLGDVAALMSALCMAYYTLASWQARASAVHVMLVGGVAGTVLALGIAFATHADWEPSTAWLAMVYVGIGPSAAGFLLWSAGMARSGGSLAPLGYVTPLLSTWLLLLAGRSFSDASAAIGALLVLLCTIGVLANDRLFGARRL